MATNEDLLFVELAVKRELLTPEQVDELLELKKKLEEMGLAEGVAELATKRRMLSDKDAKALLTRISPKGGRQQIEGYRLVERLGRGGMGAVYKAVQVSMNRPVALKVLKPSLVKSDQQTGRLRREARLVGTLRHPNIVAGLDFGVSNGFHYFAMEYVEGESIRDVLEKRGPMKEGEALRIVKEVALALEYAHGEGVVHRDVKPGNILLGKDGSVRLADYGLAKGPLEDVELTHSGVTVGTPQYISPEQARGPSDVDIRTDLYSLGATLYHMVTGQPPFEGESLAHLIQQVLYEAYTPPRKLRKDLSPSVDFLIEKLMARRPRHRYQSPRALLADLESIEKGRSIVPAGWQGDFEALYRRRKRRRLAVATALFFVLVAGLSSWLVLRNQRLERERTETAAAEALDSMLTTAVTPDGYRDRIREYERFAAKWKGTPAAERVEARLLPLLRAQLRHVEDLNELRQELRDRQKLGQFRKARELLDEFIVAKQGEPAEEAGPALLKAREAVLALIASRNEEIERRTNETVEGLRDDQPAEALEKARDLFKRLDRQMYLPETEDRTALDDLRRLVRDLGITVSGHERLLGPVAERLEKDPPRDYAGIQDDFDKARRAFEGDERIREAMARLPDPLSRKLELGFETIERRIRALNADAVDAALDQARRLIAEMRDYLAATEALEALRKRSLPEFEPPLREEQEAIAKERERLEEDALREFDAFPRNFVVQLSSREWGVLEDSLRQAEAKALTYRSSRFPPIVNSARRVLEEAQILEGDFLDQIRKMEQLPDGLWVGNALLPDLYDLQLRDRVILFRTRDGVRRSLRVEDVSLRDLLRYTSLDTGELRVAYPVALMRLGELILSGHSRELLREIDRSIRGPVIRAAGDRGGFGPFAEEVKLLLDVLHDRAEIQIRFWEEEAARAIGKIRDDYRFGRWQKVYDGIRDLLETESNVNIRDTQVLKENLPWLEEKLEEVKKKIPSLAIQEFYGTRSVHLAGESVRQRDFRERIVFDFEDERQLERFSFTEGRIGVLEVERLVLGPPPRGQDPTSERTRIERLLRFLPAKDRDDEWPKFHPLSLESPFLYQEPMAIEFRARWDRPLALLLSLAGTNVIVLSDDGRMVAGRGVLIWQGLSIESPDDRPEMQRHRATFVARNPQVLEDGGRLHEYFQFEPNRWYHVRFEKAEKEARLLVDGVVVLRREVQQYGFDSGRIVIRTWTPGDFDEVAIEGTIDPEWHHRRVVSGRDE